VWRLVVCLKRISIPPPFVLDKFKFAWQTHIDHIGGLRAGQQGVKHATTSSNCAKRSLSISFDSMPFLFLFQLTKHAEHSKCHLVLSNVLVASVCLPVFHVWGTEKNLGQQHAWNSHKKSFNKSQQININLVLSSALFS